MEVVRVERGTEALLLEALLGGAVLPQEVEGDMAQHREIFGAVADRNPALIVAEHQIEEPMDRILDAPVPADSPTEGAGVA